MRYLSNSFDLSFSMGFSVHTVNDIVKRSEVRCLKLCHSMKDPVQAKICNISYEMVSKKSLTKELSYFSAIRAFKIHV